MHHITIGAGCCENKIVGGSTYTLRGEEDTSSFSCLDKCTYSKEGEADSKYCFAAGDLLVECKGSSSGNASGATAATADGSAPTTAGSGMQYGVCGVCETCLNICPGVWYYMRNNETERHNDSLSLTYILSVFLHSSGFQFPSTSYSTYSIS